MGDCGTKTPAYEGEEHMIAAARHIVKALGACKNLTDDARRILADLDAHLTTMTIFGESSRGGLCDLEEQLKYAERKIMSWESDQSMIWDSGPEEASEYLHAVDEVRNLAERLESLSLSENGKQRELIHHAHIVLHIAMARLEKELVHILDQNKQTFDSESEYKSFYSCEENLVYEESILSAVDDSFEDTTQRESRSNESEECNLDLVHPDIIPSLKAIANVMFASSYSQEFCHAFICARRDALDEFLIILGMEKHSIHEVMKMDWRFLNRKIKKWVQAMKTVIQIYLASEQRLCNQILGELGPANPICFVEVTKASMSCLLNFGQAIAIGSHRPEKLFCLLDMYEVLSDHLIYIDALFAEESGSFVRVEFHDLLRSLGDSSRATFVEFRNAIASYSSRNPFPGGGIHPLTRYVMNYMMTLTEYGNELNMLLEDHDVEDLDPVVEPENGQENIFCPMARHLRSVTCILEYNLDCKSRLYKDCSLRHIFLMNNIHYMVQKVQGSELRVLFGDKWLRKHIGKFQQHAMSYERATWGPVLSLLRDDESPGSSPLWKACRSFGIAFEDVYKTQTAWCIPDPRLREDLRISTSQKVIHAYRSFVGRKRICDKYIKYTGDDLEKYLLDLFEGSQRSLHNTHRR
ncbi:exocyst complex component EXO70E2-like [Malania oleifera]|uniref:exocyst complex component EXO70E2-like n=1 Tax=Malania oleifera TaxID=397392 RepID=UPI0025AE3F1D|nr:exocyst complex component EXO70E2-like [Malania oleifera]